MSSIAQGSTPTIKSIQHVSLTVKPSNGFGNATISAVVVAKTVIQYGGSWDSTTSVILNGGKMLLSGSTTVTFRPNATTATDDIIGEADIVEYN